MNSAVVVGGKTFKQKIEDEVKNALTAFGLSEIMTYSFIDPKEYAMTNIEMGEVVRITNPLGEENSVMRTTTLSSMLKILRGNYNRRHDAAELFELATIYIPTEKGELPEEKQVITLGMYGDADFYKLKGIVEALLDKLGIGKYSFRPQSENPSYHPGRCAEVYIGDKKLGVIGEVHPEVTENFKIGAEVYCAELDFNTVLDSATFDKHYKALPKFPATSRDIAMVLDKGVNVGEIEKIIDKNRSNIIESYKLFDIYEGAQVGVGKKSVAYSITFRAADRTLTDDEVNAVMDKILESLKSELNVGIRD